ncbi:SgcJ/EcaC family oxidoreductase [Bacillus sp. EB01]|uniref:SgcJ/EcaC family oxidoreductase n=1 Tax=Bacillus sp. EB01 TaxID=1347086 RepID=UPI0005C5A676|nr:SgcJ/EcaC family oxidoreductase [Bacillus sp. EB01]
METSAEIQSLYRKLIEAWNKRDAKGMAVLFADGGTMIGFDGSLALGPREILSHTGPIFEHHPTPPFTVKIKETNILGADTAILRAIAGMVPTGGDDLKPELNAHQTMVAKRDTGIWKIELFQNTPAQFHGRPELVEEMTAELKQEMR